MKRAFGNKVARNKKKLKLGENDSQGSSSNERNAIGVKSPKQQSDAIINKVDKSTKSGKTKAISSTNSGELRRKSPRTPKGGIDAVKFAKNTGKIRTRSRGRDPPDLIEPGQLPSRADIERTVEEVDQVDNTNEGVNLNIDPLEDDLGEYEPEGNPVQFDGANLGAAGSSRRDGGFTAWNREEEDPEIRFQNEKRKLEQDPVVKRLIESLVDERIDEKVNEKLAEYRSRTPVKIQTPTTPVRKPITKGKGKGKSGKISKGIRSKGKDLIKSPSDTTLYMPAVNPAIRNHGANEVMDKITNFVETMRIEGGAGVSKRQVQQEETDDEEDESSGEISGDDRYQDGISDSESGESLDDASFDHSRSATRDRSVGKERYDAMPPRRSRSRRRSRSKSRSRRPRRTSSRSRSRSRGRRHHKDRREKGDPGEIEVIPQAGIAKPKARRMTSEEQGNLPNN